MAVEMKKILVMGGGSGGDGVDLSGDGEVRRRR